MNRFLTALVAKLPASLRPYAKALVPLGVGAAAVAQDLVIDAQEVDDLKTLAAAAVVSLLTLAVPNVDA